MQSRIQQGLGISSNVMGDKAKKEGGYKWRLQMHLVISSVVSVSSLQYDHTDSERIQKQAWLVKE